MAEVEIKKRKKCDPGSSSRKKRKNTEIDSEQDIDSEEKEEGMEKKVIAEKVSGNKEKNVERDSVPFDDELLIKRMVRNRKKGLLRIWMLIKGLRRLRCIGTNRGGIKITLCIIGMRKTRGFLRECLVTQGL